MVEHTHMTGPKQWPSEPGRHETRWPRVAKHTFAPVELRTSSGSARSRLPDGEALSRPPTELVVQSWHAGKAKLGEKNLDARGKQVLLYKLADIYTTLTRQHNGVVGDVARALGGSLVAPPVEVAQIRRHFGDLKDFGAINELITIVTRAVPVKATPPGVGLDRALQYGNHRSAAEHLPVI